MTVYEYDLKGVIRWIVNENVACVEDGKSGRARVREMFRQASAAGLNVIRTWVHTNEENFPFQVCHTFQSASAEVCCLDTAGGLR